MCVLSLIEISVSARAALRERDHAREGGGKRQGVRNEAGDEEADGIKRGR